MPTYFAGRVRGSDGFVLSGTGFIVTRLAGGTYRIDFPAIASGRFLMTTATPWGTAATARLTMLSKNAGDGTQFVVIEMRDAGGALVDSDFIFIALERS